MRALSGNYLHTTDEAARAAAGTFIAHRCAGLVLVAAPADERHVVNIAERIPAVYIAGTR